MRYCLPVALFLFFAPPDAAAAPLNPFKLELDQSGEFDQDGFTYLAREVLDGESMVVGGAYRERTGAASSRAVYIPPFVVKGVSTKGIVDNKVIGLKGAFRVTGTAKITLPTGQTRTVYVLELQK